MHQSVLRPSAPSALPSVRRHALRAAAARAVLEAVEPRRFLTATVSGTVFNDANKDGVRQPGEAGVGGKAVFADYNNNGALDAGEPSATTSSTGAYTLSGIKSDLSSVPVRLANTPASQIVKPSGGVYWARYNNGDVRTGLDFAIVPAAAAQNVDVFFRPRLADGSAAEYARFGGGPRYFWIDADRDGTLDADESLVSLAPSGATPAGDVPRYVFSVPAGAGFQIGAADSYLPGTAAVATLTGTAPAAGATSGTLDFVVPAVGSSYFGFLYTDANANGAYDAGDTIGVPPGTTTSFFADLNDNGVFDAFQEPSATATYAPGDAYNGYFKFGYLPSGQSFTIRPFVSSPGVVAFGEPRVAGLGANEFRRGPGVGYVGAGADTGSASGVVYNDANNSGLYEGYPYDSRAGNFAVYADLNNNGVRDRGEPTTQIGSSGERGDPAGGEYTLYDLPTGQPVTIRLLGTVDPNAYFKPTQTSRTVTIAGANGAASNVDFRFATSNAPVAATLSGTVFHDANKNGTRDAGEAGVANQVVFADYNANGVVDSGEPSVATRADGTYTLTGVKSDSSSVGLRLAGVAAANVVRPSGGVYWARYSGNDVRTGLNFAIVVPATPATATLAGRVYLDANHNGAFDAGEGTSNLEGYKFTIYADLNNNGLADAGEPTVTNADVGADGAYSLSGVPTGQAVTVRALAPLDQGMVWTGGSSPFFPAYTLTPDAATVAVPDFVRTDVAGRIVVYNGGGDVWLDLNGNLLHDAREPALAYLPPANGNESGTPSPNYAIAVPYGTFTVASRYYGDADPYADFTASATTSASDRYATVTIPPRPSSAATVRGTVFNDANKDGTQQPGEAGVGGKVVFADYNNNGVVDAGEPSTTTGSAGTYTLAGIKSDLSSVAVRLANTPASQVVKPSGGVYWARYNNGDNRTGLDFGIIV